MSSTPKEIRVDFYTDPLCCWSWAFEKPWRQLLDEFGDRIDYNYVMCGMIRDWKTYHDPINAVSKPIQMGPVWMHASEVTRTEMKYSVWHEDPPSSSWPACLAVKTAGLQSKEAEAEYLYQVRNAVMKSGENISKSDVLVRIAGEMDPALLDARKFVSDWEDGSAKNAFKDDLKKAKYHDIGRYPTLTFHKGNGHGLMIVGYRPYDTLKEVIQLLTKEQ